MFWSREVETAAETDYARQRAAMVEQQLRNRGVKDEAVLRVMEAVPRHLFIAPGHRYHAYDDSPVPIGAGQTISQPYMVAVMTEALNLHGPEKVLEIGTGSGYQTAILAMLAAHVYSIEREHELVENARQNLEHVYATGMVERGRVELIEGDGTEGYPAAAPFDGILVAAAAPSVPPALAEQLVEGGRLVIPVGDRHIQDLLLVRKLAGQLITRMINECRFVPLVGRHAWHA